jgi:hypothetical protein
MRQGRDLAGAYTCEDFALTGKPCKHVHAARIVRERDHGGKAPTMDTDAIPKKPPEGTVATIFPQKAAPVSSPRTWPAFGFLGAARPGRLLGLPDLLLHPTTPANRIFQGLLV